MAALRPATLTEKVGNAVSDTPKSTSYLNDKLQTLRGESLNSKGPERVLSSEPRLTPEFLQSVFDALPAHVAVLDEEGTIIAVNAAWRKFADANRLGAPNHAIGVNYFQQCASTTGDDAEQARAVANAIRDVATGKIENFSTESPCHSPDEDRWFLLNIT